MTGNLARSPYGAPLAQPPGGSGAGGGGGGASTLSGLYALGASQADSTITLNTTAAGIVIDGSAAAVDPLTVINGKNLSGYILKASGSAPPGYVIQDSTATRQGAFALAIAANDWITSSVAGDLVITGPTTAAKRMLIKCGASGGVQIGSNGSTGNVSKAWAQFVDTSLAIGCDGAYVLATGDQVQFLTGGTARMTIAVSTGNALLGTTSDSNNAKIAVAKGSVTSTSGTQRSIFSSASFAPTSGTAVFRADEITYTINQTGGANGAVTGIYLDATETAVVGTHLLMDLKVGGVTKFKVAPNGIVTNGISAVAANPGGGGTAIIGTVTLGSGPINTPQNSWGRMDWNGVAFYVPLWT